MEEALVDTGRGARRRRRRASKDIARIIVSIFLMVMLIWIIHKGYELATNARRDGEIPDSEDSYIALVFGMATMVSGLVYFIIGLTVVAELAGEFLAWLQFGDKGDNNHQEKEQRRIYKVTIQASTTTISIVMLTWAIYHSYRLAAETPKGGIHNCLAFLIGFITMAFGFVYFIIGISIVVESALYLSGKLQHKVTGNGIRDQERKSDALLAV